MGMEAVGKGTEIKTNERREINTAGGKREKEIKQQERR
jgi:hypothetical protein